MMVRGGTMRWLTFGLAVAALAGCGEPANTAESQASMALCIPNDGQCGPRGLPCCSRNCIFGFCFCSPLGGYCNTVGDCCDRDTKPDTECLDHRCTLFAAAAQ